MPALFKFGVISTEGGLNGKAGQLIVREAIERGNDVTAFVRSENRTVAENVVVKDIMDLTPKDLVGFDAVVDAFGAWTPETLPQHSTTLAHLCDILSDTDTRLSRFMKFENTMP